VDQQTMDDQLITQYLLGSLSAEETERLDELSLTDDEFARRLQAVENELIDAYVEGELSGQTLEQFNSFYLSSPRRRERVGFAQALHTVAERAAVGKQAANQQPVVRGPQVSPTSRTPWTSGLRLPSRPRLPLQWGLAAAASLLLVAGSWLMMENWRLRGQMKQASAERTGGEQRQRELLAQLAEQRSLASAKEKEVADLRESLDRLKQGSTGSSSQPRPEVPTIVAFALAAQTRGISQIATLTIPAGTDYVAIELQLESGDYPGYRATLEAVPENQVIWRSGRLKARSSGDFKVVGISLRPALLKSSRYMFEVFGIAADGSSSEIAGSYAFRVVRQ
jgi:hypothetical protein